MNSLTVCVRFMLHRTMVHGKCEWFFFLLDSMRKARYVGNRSTVARTLGWHGAASTVFSFLFCLDDAVDRSTVCTACFQRGLTWRCSPEPAIRHQGGLGTIQRPSVLDRVVSSTLIPGPGQVDHGTKALVRHVRFGSALWFSRFLILRLHR